MLKIEKRGVEFEVVVCCDWCGMRIEDARDARYEWLLTAQGEPQNGGQIYYAHQVCSPTAAHHDPSSRFIWHSAPLDAFPDNLARSLQLKDGWPRCSASLEKLD